jgi:hypothetical protein
LAIAWPQRWRDAKPYATALAIFFSSRLVVLLGVNAGAIYLPLWKTDLWQSGTHWYDHLLRWDSEWYAGIAAHGYYYDGNPDDLQPVGFYPLYPLIARGVAWLGVSPAVALLLVANVAAVLAVLVFFHYVRRRFGDDTAILAVAFLSFYPGSLFLSAGYTEPLALLLILCFFWCCGERYYLAAAVCAGFAAGTRSTGIVLFPVLMWELWLRFGNERARFVAVAAVLGVVATAGLWLYMTYLGFAFGHPLAFAEEQVAFNGGSSLGQRFVGALTLQPFQRLRFTDFSPAGWDQWFFLLFVALTVLAWRRLAVSLALVTLGVLMLPYLTLSGGPAGFTSMTRFSVLAFPGFIILAQLCGAVPWLVMAVIGLFAAVLGLDAALFGQWYWVG